MCPAQPWGSRDPDVGREAQGLPELPILKIEDIASDQENATRVP